VATTGNLVSTTTGAPLWEREKVDPELYLRRRDRRYIRDIAASTTVADLPETIIFEEEGDSTGVIGIVTENGLKPQVGLSLIKNRAEKQKAGGFVVVTDEILRFRTRTWAAIIRLFTDKIFRDYEDKLAEQLDANTVQYVGTAMDGTIETPNDFDALCGAMCQLESLNFYPDTLILNPSDKWKIATIKNSTGTYLFPYVASNGEFAFLPLNVITTNKVAAGTFILGESNTFKVEEELPQMRIGYVNDDLIHNRLTIVGELYFISYMPSNNAGAWIKTTFDEVKEALVAPAA
jgi:HK97 family phage major capsid protein